MTGVQTCALPIWAMSTSVGSKKWKCGDGKEVDWEEEWSRDVALHFKALRDYRGGTVGSSHCEGEGDDSDVAEKDGSRNEESETRVSSSNQESKARVISPCDAVDDEFEKEYERDRVAYWNALHACGADKKEEGRIKE